MAAPTAPRLSALARWSTVAFALAGAALLAIAVQAGRWWAVGEVTIGPTGTEACFSGECRPRGLAWLAGGELWHRGGIATWAAGLVAAVVLVVLAAGTAAGRVPRLAARTEIVAALTAGVVGGYFIARFPGVEGATLDRGIPCFIAGVVCALAAAAIVLARRR